MNKIAICGFTSNVGRCFMDRCKNKYEFVCIGRSSEAEINVDLRERKISGDVEKLIDCGVFINFAAQTEDNSAEEILDLMNVNVLGPSFLAELAHKYQISKFIEISSISATYAPADAYYGYYAQSKKSADEILSCYCGDNRMDLCILRPAAIWGPDGFKNHQRLFYQLMDQVKSNQDVHIYGSLDARRNYIHVNTLIDVICGVIEKNVTGVHNVLNPRNQRISEIVEDMNRFYEKNSKIVFDKDRPDVNECFFEKDEEIYQRTGIQPPMGVYEELIKGGKNFEQHREKDAGHPEMPAR